MKRGEERACLTAELTSATLGRGVLAASLGDLHGGEGLGCGGMDPHQVIKVCLGGAQPDAKPIALGHLPGIGSQVVEADHPLVQRLDADQLAVAGVLRPVGQGPLQRPEVGVVDLNVLGPIPLDGLFFGEAAAAILQRGEHGGADVLVVGEVGGHATEPAGQKAASLNGHRGQLRLVRQDVTNGVDVGQARLFIHCVEHLPVRRVQLYSDLVEADAGRAGVRADGKDDRVEIVRVGLSVLVLAGDLDHAGAARLQLLQPGGDALHDKVDAVLLHVLAHFERHLLVKVPEEDGADHDGDLQPQPGQEAGALQGDVAGPHQQGPAGGVGQAEQIIRCDAQLPVTLISNNTFC